MIEIFTMGFGVMGGALDQPEGQAVERPPA
jgi:hypothetical protein